MFRMFVTLEVSKLSGWLNTNAQENMKDMSVTLDVSKLSGWLNTDASCRVAKRAYCAGRGCGPVDGGDGVQHAGEGSIWGQNSRSGTNRLEHPAHVRDAGGIPV